MHVRRDVALGYHSAVEVVEGTLAYLAQDLRSVLEMPKHDDAGYVLGNIAATKLIVELVKDQQLRQAGSS